MFFFLVLFEPRYEEEKKKRDAATCEVQKKERALWALHEQRFISLVSGMKSSVARGIYPLKKSTD